MTSPKGNSVKNDTSPDPLAAEDLPTTETSNDPPTGPVRRSARSKKVPANYEAGIIISGPKASLLTPSRSSRPKRKAADMAEKTIAANSDRILDEVIERMKPGEHKEWAGWVELESDPAFFNAMLHMLGAREFKINEVFGLDDELLDMLPNPVFGLVFLSQYTTEESLGEKRAGCPEDLWFANQTTANACATVALMNILMNTPDPRFGNEMQQFKDETNDALPPRRGHMLDTNDFIRGVHNSVARRLDLLSEDLILQSKYEDQHKSLQRNKRSMKGNKKTSKKASTTNKKPKKVDPDACNHYIAYVPLNGKVWELDGLEANPLCLGEHEEGNWLGRATEAIQTRMAVYENLTYNILALCQSPQVSLVDKLATNVACAQNLDTLFRLNPAWTLPSPFTIFTDPKLSEFNLTRAQVDSKPLPESFVAKTRGGDFSVEQAQRMMNELSLEQQSIETDYAEELANHDEAIAKIQGRQRDYTPLIHTWVRLLSQAGVLKGLIKSVG
ncbi:uncharacterized protein BCR38DRAFT_412000 [Pseudomassariella vexata]|uniref:Ubiquitin carboxyl-terminal hydrolase n=1 Tax=Pseudomassariella vexata TaxID=1141098 RepID=A0A1Y2DNM2_9PEZI|nr:uncharacterized protein BCR38DRAFT_412000 [Pseudomassariella vexata]ORY60893.1 hypothetical protein BCR38DRAFT_412000 [Pseudomassariella vexata]